MNTTDILKLCEIIHILRDQLGGIERGGRTNIIKLESHMGEVCIKEITIIADAKELITEGLAAKIGQLENDIWKLAIDSRDDTPDFLDKDEAKQ